MHSVNRPTCSHYWVGWNHSPSGVRYIQGRGPCIIVGRCLATKVFIGKVLLTRGV